MFYEALLLGSQSCLKLRQKEPFGDVKLAPRPKLRNVMRAAGVLDSEDEDEAPVLVGR
jgi:hypothetical protein